MSRIQNNHVNKRYCFNIDNFKGCWMLWWCLLWGCFAESAGLMNQKQAWDEEVFSWSGNNFHTYPHPDQRPVLPSRIMVDVVNGLGLKLLAIHNEHNEDNIAISPYGALSILVALGEGLQGEAVKELQRSLHLPNDISLIRIGLRDIHRHLKSYFIPKEGFLAGLTLNHENVTLKPQYEEILKFYGFDIMSFNNALYPDPGQTETTENPTPVDDSPKAPPGVTVNAESTTQGITTEESVTTTTTPELITTTTTTEAVSTTTTTEQITETTTEVPKTEDIAETTSELTTTTTTTEATTTTTTTEPTTTTTTTTEAIATTTEQITTTSTTIEPITTTTEQTTTPIESTTTESIAEEEAATTESVAEEEAATTESVAEEEAASTESNTGKTETTESNTEEIAAVESNAEELPATTEECVTETTPVIEEPVEEVMSRLTLTKRKARSHSNFIELNTGRYHRETRQPRSTVDYLIARYYDHYPENYQIPSYQPQALPSFLVQGKYREIHVNFMSYDTVLPYFYLTYLKAVALSFPLDNEKYYLLLLLPVDPSGIDKLICDLRLNGSLKYIIDGLRLRRVHAVIPSFMLKGYVNLTPTLQKLGIRRVFEPRQADFSPMTNLKEIYITNIEQAITVNIRNYVDPESYDNGRQYIQDDPIQFRVDHPFLYFVMDAELHVALMSGKIVNPLNNRIT